MFPPKLIGFLRLVRLSNSLPASALVLIGSKLAGVWPPTAPVWQAAIAMWCVTAFGYASNDLFDIAEDRINKPDRPLPSDTITRQEALLLTCLLAISALFTAWLLGWFPLTVAALVMLLLTAYNRWLKGKAAQGNLLIALLAGCTFFVGGVAANGITLNTIKPLLIPAAILASFIVTREILKTIEDEAGDKFAGRETVVTRWSSHIALKMVNVGAFATILLLQIPYWWLDYSIYYLSIALIGVAVPLLFTTFYLRNNITIKRVQLCLALLKGSYFAGILALWLA